MSYIKTAPVAGVPDEAYTVEEVRLCDWSFGSFDSSVWDLGTDGYALMKWTRVGRTVSGWLAVSIDTDYTTPSGFFIIVHPDDLPYPQKSESAATGNVMTGGFGTIYKADTAGSPPYNGYRHGLSPAVQNIGGANVFPFFRTASEDAIAGGADNLWSPIVGTPVAPSTLGGALLITRFIYEAADAV